jgi:3-methylcrotonyl-CoA carboxylase beta subunit
VSVIQSAVHTRSDEFKANAAAMRVLIDDLHEKSALVIRGGSEQARAKHLARGKLLPRERIDALLDPGSAFLELSTLAAYGMYGEKQGNARLEQRAVCRRNHRYWPRAWRGVHDRGE